MIKRVFDMSVSLFGLVILSPLLLMAAALIKLTSRGPVFFRQERMGRGFRPFHILKFRTMVPEAPTLGGQITAGKDPRITRIGNLLRKTKVDELPQLINVLKGDMSFVGPRPEVPVRCAAVDQRAPDDRTPGRRYRLADRPATVRTVAPRGPQTWGR